MWSTWCLIQIEVDIDVDREYLGVQVWVQGAGLEYLVPHADGGDHRCGVPGAGVDAGFA